MSNPYTPPPSQPGNNHRQPQASHVFVVALVMLARRRSDGSGLRNRHLRRSPARRGMAVYNGKLYAGTLPFADVSLSSGYGIVSTPLIVPHL